MMGFRPITFSTTRGESLVWGRVPRKGVLPFGGSHSLLKSSSFQAHDKKIKSYLRHDFRIKYKAYQLYLRTLTESSSSLNPWIWLPNPYKILTWPFPLKHNQGLNFFISYPPWNLTPHLQKPNQTKNSLAYFIQKYLFHTPKPAYPKQIPIRIEKLVHIRILFHLD